MSNDLETYKGNPNDVSRRGKSPAATKHLTAMSKRAAKSAAFKNQLRPQAPVTLRRFSFELGDGLNK